jgi:hypothetical protein
MALAFSTLARAGRAGHGHKKNLRISEPNIPPSG